MSIQIFDLQHAVPAMNQSAAEVAELIGKSSDWVLKRTVVGNRHVSGHGENDPAVFAARVARPLIERCGKPDLVLYCGAIPRRLPPETSAFVHQHLGLKATPSFTINAACLSFLVALRTAEALILAHSYHRILISCCELASRGRNFDSPESAALMGDGAAAVMLEPVPQSGFEWYQMETHSQHADLIYIGRRRTPSLAAP